MFVEHDAGFEIAQQLRQLPVQEWEIAKILTIMLDQVEGVENRDSSGLTAVTTPRTVTSRPVPSTTASPSIVKLLALIPSAAAAIAANRSVPS
jgi:hypothetical protein